MKRSTAVTLAVLGAGAAALVAASQSRTCRDSQGNEVSCRSGSGGSGGWHSTSGSGSSSSSQTTVARGGFGATGASASGG